EGRVEHHGGVLGPVCVQCVMNSVCLGLKSPLSLCCKLMLDDPDDLHPLFIPPLSPSCSLSLSLSLTHTHTHTHRHVLTHAHGAHTQTHINTHTHTLTYTRHSKKNKVLQRAKL